MMTFEDIDYRTEFDIEVREDQKDFVASLDVTFGRAWMYRNCRPHCNLIKVDGEGVGIMLWYDNEDLGVFDIAELMIDRKSQGKGYGTMAMEKALAEMKADGKYEKASLFFEIGDTAAEHLYKKLGFVETVRNDEAIAMEKVL